MQKHPDVNIAVTGGGSGTGIPDHATNIAEDVIFMVDALVIKHHADAKEEG